MAEAASGVAARRGRAAAKKKKRRRSQVAKALVLKRADELLEESGKAEEIRQRRGSLGTLRPEDVSFNKYKKSSLFYKTHHVRNSDSGFLLRHLTGVYGILS